MLSAVYDYIFCQLCNCIGYGFILIKRQAFLTIIAEPYRLKRMLAFIDPCLQDSILRCQER